MIMIDNLNLQIYVSKFQKIQFWGYKIKLQTALREKCLVFVTIITG